MAESNMVEPKMAESSLAGKHPVSRVSCYMLGGTCMLDPRPINVCTCAKYMNWNGSATKLTVKRVAGVTP